MNNLQFKQKNPHQQVMLYGNATYTVCIIISICSPDFLYTETFLIQHLYNPEYLYNLTLFCIPKTFSV